MAEPPPPRIFISYARKDGAPLAQYLQSALTQEGFDAWLDEQRLQGGAVWSVEIEREIDARQVTMALLSPGAYASEICRAEQLRALDKGNRVIPVLAVKGADRPLYLYARQYRDFTDASQYAARLSELIADIRGDATATLRDAYRKTRVTYLTAPPRVANYIPRTEAVRALRNALFAEDHRQPIALTALAGMGGIGKTVLAKALTEDEVAQRAFPDGIVWITAGKERKRDFIEEMREVAKALGDDLSGYDTALACEHRYRTTIANKAALIVVDDVWSKADIELLLAESPRSRFLFTTRDAGIGRFVGAQEHRADLLDVAQSRELLAAWANLPVAKLPSVADEIIRECGRLPLALSVVGAMLRGGDAQFWKDTVDLLLNADLSAIQEQLPEGQQSFFKAVEVSFHSLTPEMQERYRALAVLLEDMAAGLPILQTLWNANEAEARRISKRFVDLSLAQTDGAAASIRLHNLQLDYVRAQYPNRNALPLIHESLRLSSDVVQRDPTQFASQMVGRLLPYRDDTGINEFVRKISVGAPRPWMRPLGPALTPPGMGLIRTLAADTGVYAVALSADGKVAVAGSDWSLKVWEVGSGRERMTLRTDFGRVRSVTLSADGNVALAASEDYTMSVWELESGQKLRKLPGRGERVAVSADGKVAVSGTYDGTLKVWDVDSGQELRSLQGHHSICAVAVSADGKVVTSGAYDGTLKAWDVESGRERGNFKGADLQTYTPSVWTVALTGDGNVLVSGSHDGTIKVWRVESGQELRRLQGHGGPVRSVAVSEDGKVAVSASDDRTLKVWDVVSGREHRTLQGHGGPVRSVAVSADGKVAVSVSEDQTLKVWNVVSGWADRSTQGHRGPVRGIAVSADGKVAVSASDDQTLKVWDVVNGCECSTLEGHRGPVRSVAVSADGKIAVSASDDRTLKVWDVDSGQERGTLEGHIGYVQCVALSADGKVAVSGSWDRTVKVWDMVSGRERSTFEGHHGQVSGVAVTADGKLAVSGAFDCTLKVWEVESGRERWMARDTFFFYGVAVSADGKVAVSTSGAFPPTLKVWDVDAAGKWRTLPYDSRVIGVAVSADGNLVVSASSDRTLKVWELESGICLTTFHCEGPVEACALAAGAIAAGDGAGRVYLFALEL